jgi:hypothetical protein
MRIDVDCVIGFELLIFTFKDEEEQDWQSAKAHLTVLQIRDILLRIRISVPMPNVSGSYYFCHWPSRLKQNIRNRAFSYYFCLIIEKYGSSD